MTKKTTATILLLLLVCVGLCLFALWSNPGSEFGGADGAAGEAVLALDPDYEPWAESPIQLPGGETESLLFCLQAALGAGVLGFGFGFLAGRKKYDKKAAE